MSDISRITKDPEWHKDPKAREEVARYLERTGTASRALLEGETRKYVIPSQKKDSVWELQIEQARGKVTVRVVRNPAKEDWLGWNFYESSQLRHFLDYMEGAYRIFLQAEVEDALKKAEGKE
jgi:hypothetical protein